MAKSLSLKVSPAGIARVVWCAADFDGHAGYAPASRTQGVSERVDECERSWAAPALPADVSLHGMPLHAHSPNGSLEINELQGHLYAKAYSIGRVPLAKCKSGDRPHTVAR